MYRKKDLGEAELQRERGEMRQEQLWKDGLFHM
jgi:hypothetical protein